MDITSAKFIKGVVRPDAVLEDGTPQVAFIGRSNVGKSSVINSLVRQKDLARTSSFPGRTQELNVFLINDALYLVDLPGYGFAKNSREGRDRIQELIQWYLFDSGYEQKMVVLIIDAVIGPRDIDLETLRVLEIERKEIVVVANKIDKIKKSNYARQMKKIQDLVGVHTVIPYSAEKKLGVATLTDAILE